jgi:hypothetical protein
MMTFERLDLDAVDWKQLDALPDRTVYQTRPWLDFIARAQNAEPVVAMLREGNDALAYFTGLMVKKCGLRILGSPFPGWTSDYMGFNLASDVPRREALKALESFAFHELRCVHIELMDRNLTVEDAATLGFEFGTFQTYEVNLNRSEEKIFASLDNDVRRCVRKSVRDGVTIEEAYHPDFVDDYYAQLQDVFAKQGLVPTYGIERGRLLFECLYPTGRLLLLRARDKSGRCIGTGIFPAMNDTAFFWGGASWRQYQYLHPNDPIHWYAMCYWRERGMQRYDLGGGGKYKEKYGGRIIAVPWLRKSMYRFIAPLRNAAQRVMATSQRVRGYLQSRR